MPPQFLGSDLRELIYTVLFRPNPIWTICLSGQGIKPNNSYIWWIINLHATFWVFIAIGTQRCSIYKGQVNCMQSAELSYLCIIKTEYLDSPFQRGKKKISIIFLSLRSQLRYAYNFVYTVYMTMNVYLFFIWITTTVISETLYNILTGCLNKPRL